MKEPGLGARLTAAVEEATARALAFPLSGSPASKNTRRERPSRDPRTKRVAHLPVGHVVRALDALVRHPLSRWLEHPLLEARRRSQTAQFGLGTPAETA